MKPKDFENSSVDSPEKEEKSSFNIKKIFKDFGKGLLWTIDDIWYATLKALEEFNLRDDFQKFIYTISHIFQRACY